MAEVMQIHAAGSGTITFSPVIDGHYKPDVLNTTIWKADDASPYFYKGGAKDLYELRMNNVSYADATAFNTWCESKTRLTFYPDTVNAAAATIGVYAVNETAPFQMWGANWRTLYSGTIILHEA